MTQPVKGDAVSRRTLLRAAGIAGAIVPVAAIGPRVFASGRGAASLPGAFAAPPICHAAAEVPVEVPMTVVPGPRRQLRLTWNASAICTVGVPVAQTKGLFAKRNVDVELINFGLLRSQSPRVTQALRLVGLTDFADAYPHQLSGGMAQRAALARALVNDPSLLLLDEPLGKLDSITRIAMQGELVALWQRTGFTALLVTHDVEEALFLANRVIVLSDRPAAIKADIPVELPYPRHRGDQRLAGLRREVFGLLGLDATW